MKNRGSRPTQEEAVREIDRRSTAEAARLKEKLGQPGPASIVFRMIFHSKLTFFRHYFGHLKILKGFEGFRSSVNAAIETFSAYAKLYEMLYSSDAEKRKAERELDEDNPL